MFRALGKVLVALTLSACASRAHTVPRLDVTVAERQAGIARPSPHGSCAAGASRYVAPPGARTLVTPAPDRTLTLAGSENRLWYGLGDGLRGELLDVWASGPDVIAVGSGRLLRSRDGGRTFDDVTAPIPARAAWGEGRDLFLAAGASLARSGDGGATWSVSEPFAADGTVEAIAGEGADLYEVGAIPHTGELAVAHSRDRGSTWEPLTLPVTRGWLRAIAIRPTAGGGHEVIVGGLATGSPFEPLLLASSDCGATWTRRWTAGTDGDRVEALCATPKRIVIATSSAVHVLDDGAQPSSLPVGSEVRALACREDVIVAAGRSGAVIRSSDGGVTWSREEPLGASIQALELTDDGTLYAVGDSIFRRLPR